MDDLWQMGTLLFSGSVAEVNRDTLCRPAENGDNCDHNSLWLLTNYPRHVLQTIGGWNAAWSPLCFGLIVESGIRTSRIRTSPRRVIFACFFGLSRRERVLTTLRTHIQQTPLSTTSEGLLLTASQHSYCDMTNENHQLMSTSS